MSKNAWLWVAVFFILVVIPVGLFLLGAGGGPVCGSSGVCN